MQHNIVETLVGLLVIALTATFIAYGYSVVERQNVVGYDLTARFDKVDGLTIGSDVRLSGIKVGTITALDLDKRDYFAIVSMTLDSEVVLPDDSSAKITSEGLLGGNYISLSAGGSEDLLINGDEIVFTQGAVDLIGLVGQALFSTGDEKENK
ncbi:MAG: outer membrane lipid asymmetry maintenance protein MlaD [Alphaproteobacteria bacterium]|nr:outer membrane lipid asymmetry maintenance protein MlaD [Alphaproteobacteria bacterium]MBE8220939.1 outer membrane lipid asymmetry maintenance protein MlaD [Alphaproteobacteria bacterium]